MLNIEKISCQIVKKEPKSSIEDTSSTVIRGPPTLYVGKTKDGRTVLIKGDHSPLDLDVGKHADIERLKLLDLIPLKDNIVYPDGRREHVYMKLLKSKTEYQMVKA